MPKSTSPAIRAAAIEALESRRLLSGALYENDFSSAASVGAADGITASWSHSTLSTAPNGE
jgi:hypothetical protein